MTSDKRTTDYAALAIEAEAAVAAVKDPELRLVAYEKILTTLLQATPNAVPNVSPATTGFGKARRRVAEEAAKRKTKKGPKSYVGDLIGDGFFRKPRTIAEVKAELANQGHHIALTSLSGPLQSLTRERKLRRQKVASNGKGTKTTYAYSNW